METFLKDSLYGFRLLLKKPGFATVVVLTLALGIGANTAIFSVIDALLLTSLPYKEADRLVLFSTTTKSAQVTNSYSSFPDIEDWRASSSSFEAIASFKSAGFTLTGEGEAERVEAAQVSSSFFPILRVNPIHGRTFLEADDRPGSERVALVSHSFWQNRFGGDPDLVGRALMLSGNPYTVVGVMPPDFNFPIQMDEAELWVSTAYEGGNLQSRGAQVTSAIARLKPGVTLEQAQAEMDRIMLGLEEKYPETNTDRIAIVTGLQDQLVSKVKLALWLMFGAVGFVMLIACANVANLLLVRASSRQKEFAVRLALGASRGRIVRQLLTESLALALLGGCAGLLFAVWGLDLLLALSPDDLPRVDSIGIDGRVLGFTLAASLLTGVIFGLAPALKFSRPDLNEGLKEGGRTSSGAGRNRLRGTLVVAEVALSVVLLVSAGLLVKSFLRIQRIDPGFNPESLLTLRISTPRAKYPKGEQRAEFFRQVLDRVRVLPGVRTAAFVTPAPFTNNNVNTSFVIEGRPAPPLGQEPGADVRGITPGYFEAMEIPLIRGRQFSDADRKGQVGVAIINEEAARRFWPGSDPVGQRISSVGVGVDADEPEQWEIVGVVGNVKHVSLDKAPRPEVYLPHGQQSWGWGHLVVRTAGDPMSLAPAVRSQIHAVDKDQPVYNVRPMEQMIASSFAAQRFYMLLLGIFAAVGLVLALVGIYSVISYSVTESTREIGIRMALGAQKRDVLGMVLRHGMIMALVGVGLGLVAAWAMTRVLSSLLFEVSTTDPLIFASISFLLLAMALIACYLPARKATTVDPMVALRYE
ncbi:MAG TPA: ABC transporter permease [Blastocatellia bacterium]|nr:ABC transporter permease [Blastocatellia bacterium]